jgi:serine/threonine protein kinase
MELCVGGSLRDVLTRLTPAGSPAPEHLIWTVLAHVAAGLAHLHAAGIVHLDIKPDNILAGEAPEAGAATGGGAGAAPRAAFKVGDLGLATEFHVHHHHHHHHGHAGASGDADASMRSLAPDGSTVSSRSGAGGDDDVEGDSR